MKNKRKLNLSIDTNQISQMQRSVYTQIGNDGLKFLKYDIQVGSKGLTTISGQQLNVLLPTDKSFFKTQEVQLGKGSACTVRLAIYQPLGIKVAIKTINIHDRDKRHQVMNDIRVLLQNLVKQQQNGFKCQFIVNLYGAYYDQGSLKVILELMDGGSLADIINVYRKAKVQPKIDQKILVKIAIQILCGLAYLHSNNHLHRDIKPGNILTNTKGEVKISDFGISKELVQKQNFSKTFVGTRSYMSPQRIQGKQYSYKSDIWSFGLVMYELATSYFPYKNSSQFELRDQFYQVGAPKLPQKQYSQDFQDFIRLSLSIQQQNRGSVLQLMGHKWILKNLSPKASIKNWLLEIKERVVPLIQHKQKQK